MEREANGESSLTRARERLGPPARRAASLAWDLLRQGWRLVRVGWQIARPVLRTAMQIVLALLILLEEWGWRPLGDLLGRLARWRAWAQVEYGIARLPPYAALIVF